MARVPVSMQDKQKSYFKYYAQPMAQPDPEKLAEAAKGPGDNKDALSIHDRNDLFKLGELPGEFGYWALDDGSCLVANKTFMPGVSGEMFDWWFAWHPIDRLRYAMWDHEDHFDCQLEDRERPKNPNIPIRERTWGSRHWVWESMLGVEGAELIRIEFERPADMGYDESMIDGVHCGALVCANGTTLGNLEMPDAPAVMTHFIRPVEGGSVLRSRFWMGWRIIDGKAVNMLPEGVKIPPVVAQNLLKHNVKEFTNLAHILPSVYAEEKDNWE